MTEEELLEGIRRCVADVLLITDVERVQLGASLVADLGADSLDFLDLVFQLEEKFGVKISRGEVNLFSNLEIPESEAHQDGVLTRKALDRLQELMPEAHPDAFLPGLTVAGVPKLLTVETFLNIVRRKLEEKKLAAS